MMHVVAGVLVDAEGKLLIAERPSGKHLAGYWEFPGGKREAGEASDAALVRELDEELGILADPSSFEPLIQLPWRYGERDMLLEAIVVRVWTGVATAVEAPAIAWLDARHIDVTQLAPADRSVLAKWLSAT